MHFIVDNTTAKGLAMISDAPIVRSATDLGPDWMRVSEYAKKYNRHESSVSAMAKSGAIESARVRFPRRHPCFVVRDSPPPSAGCDQDGNQFCISCRQYLEPSEFSRSRRYVQGKRCRFCLALEQASRRRVHENVVVYNQQVEAQRELGAFPDKRLREQNIQGHINRIAMLAIDHPELLGDGKDWVYDQD